MIKLTVRKAPVNERGAARFVVLDFYRFIAASGVVVLHFCSLAQPDDGWLKLSSRDFYLFVDFFFILSGFIIAYTYARAVDSPKAIAIFLRRRIARVYPLYFFTLVFFLVSSLSGISHYPNISSGPSILSQLTMTTSWALNAQLPFNFPAWSISVEWAMYLLFPLLVFVSRRSGIWILPPIIVAGFILNELYIDSNILSIPVWFLDINVIRAVPTFTIGVLIAAVVPRFSNPYGVWLGLSAFIASLAMMVGHVNIYPVLCMFALTVFFTASGELVRRPMLFENSICKALGDASYSVYLLHIIIIMVAVDFVWKKYTGTSNFPVLLFVFGLFPFIVFCSVLTYRVFEKPARELIAGRRILSTTKRAPA